MTAHHADRVLAIYQAGIDEGNATFETSAPTWEAFDAAKLPEHRFVALDETGTVLGRAAVVAVSDRCVGSALLTALIDSTEQAGIWTIQSGIFPENTASLALLARRGFSTVGTRQKVVPMVELKSKRRPVAICRAGSGHGQVQDASRSPRM